MPTFTLDQLGDFEKYLKDEVKNGAHRGLLSAALRTLAEVQGKIMTSLKPPPIDRGQARGGWRVEPTEKGADLVNPVPHMVFIDQGVNAAMVKPGRAMIDALTAWTQRKGLVAKKAGDAAARGVAWAIAMAAKKRGIFVGGTGFHITEKAVEFFEKIVTEEVEREVGR